jgi:hypothetical protein
VVSERSWPCVAFDALYRSARRAQVPSVILDRARVVLACWEQGAPLTSLQRKQHRTDNDDDDDGDDEGNENADGGDRDRAALLERESRQSTCIDAFVKYRQRAPEDASALNMLIQAIKQTL